MRIIWLMYANRLILFLAVSAFLLSPLLVNWYAAQLENWFHPFIVWGVLILICFWMMRSKDLND